MSHEEFENKLLQYYYKELEEAESKAFEAHLKDCAQCSRELQSLKAVALELDRAFKDAEPGPEALAQILARAREKNTMPSMLAGIFKPRWAFSMAAGLALFIALAVAAWMVFMRPSRENYDFNQVAMNLESVQQDMDSLSANTHGQSPEAGLAQADSAMAANDSSYLIEDQGLDSMERELNDIESIASGIF
jgi:hypothetical protein